MNLLVLTPLVPYPPHDGDKLRLHHFLKHLKAKGHVIDLFCLTRVASDIAHASALRPLCRKIHLEHLTNGDLFFNLIGGGLMAQSMNVSSYFSPRLRDSLAAYWGSAEGRSIDVVLAHRLRMAPAAFEGNPGKPVVLELTDCLTDYARQMREQRGARSSRKLLSWWDYFFLQKEEFDWSGKAFRSVVISRPDAEALKELGIPEEKLAVIPNGVDPVRGARGKRPAIYPEKDPVVCFVGNMGYAANEDGVLWFLRKVWPLVKKEFPRAVFAAVGGQPRECLKKFHNDSDLFVTGWVPEIEPYVRHASLTVAPLRVAAGMQNKVALSLSLGVPVVATPQAVVWMSPEGRDCVLTGVGEDLFAAEVIGALKNPKKARALAMRGKRFISKNYRWSDSGRRLEQVLKEASKTSTRGRLI